MSKVSFLVKTIKYGVNLCAYARIYLHGPVGETNHILQKV